MHRFFPLSPLFKRIQKTPKAPQHAKVKFVCLSEGAISGITASHFRDYLKEHRIDGVEVSSHGGSIIRNGVYQPPAQDVIISIINGHHAVVLVNNPGAVKAYRDAAKRLSSKKFLGIFRSPRDSLIKTFKKEFPGDARDIEANDVEPKIIYYGDLVRGSANIEEAFGKLLEIIKK